MHAALQTYEPRPAPSAHQKPSEGVAAANTDTGPQTWVVSQWAPAHLQGGARSYHQHASHSLPSVAFLDCVCHDTGQYQHEKNSGCNVWGAGRAPGGGPAASWACSAASAAVGGRPSAGSASAVTLALGASGDRRATAAPSTCDVSACADAWDAAGLLNGSAGLGALPIWPTRQQIVCQVRAPAAEAYKSPPCARARRAAGAADAAVLLPCKTLLLGYPSQDRKERDFQA